jgi:hypothetical protein
MYLLTSVIIHCMWIGPSRCNVPCRLNCLHISALFCFLQIAKLGGAGYLISFGYQYVAAEASVVLCSTTHI